MWGTRGMFTRILGNVIILTFREMLQKIPGNVRRDSGKCSRRLREMFKKTPGNVIILTFRVMLQKIPGNAQEDFGEFKFRFIL